MAPPTKLDIATGVVVRLVKEEASYHKEIEQQEARIKHTESNPSDENAEYTLRQEVQSSKSHIFAICIDRPIAPSTSRNQECLACYEDKD